MAVVDLEPVAPLAVSCTEAGRRLGGLHRDTVRRMVHDGVLARVPGTGRRILIPVRSIEALVMTATPDLPAAATRRGEASESTAGAPQPPAAPQPAVAVADGASDAALRNEHGEGPARPSPR